MTEIALFVFGFVATLLCGAALALFGYAAMKDGEENRHAREMEQAIRPEVLYPVDVAHLARSNSTPAPADITEDRIRLSA